MSKIAVIGGGPAGMFAAGFAAKRGHEVFLFEKNEKLGKKLFITGKGRCNFTNSADIETLFDNIVTNKNFLYSALYSFTNEDTINFFNKYGLKSKVERGGRVFPSSDKSSDVIKAIKKFLEEYDVKVSLNTPVEKIVVENSKIKGIMLDAKNLFECDSVILATGGKSYPQTGSTGEGYIMVKNLGHNIVPLKPSLVPIDIKEQWVKELQGLSLKNVALKLFYNNKIIEEYFGEMIFTHFGISGPIVLSLSSKISKEPKNYKLELNLKPALDEKKLDNRIQRDFAKNSNKNIKNALSDLLPQKLIPVIIKLININPEKKINQIKKDERTRLLKVLQHMEMQINNLRPIQEAIITSGGINVKEINPSTMESKLVQGLFFTGEIIDIDALTGGYNLQIAFSTGYIAGNNC